jgi:hypothetical protein
MDINDLYNDVTSGGSGTYTLEYQGAEFEFSVRALKRTRKNDVLAALPQGFLDPTGLPDGLDPEDAAELIDAMVDAFDHPKLSDTELENILTTSQFPDREFNRMLNKMIEVSSPDESVRDFRGES